MPMSRAAVKAINREPVGETSGAPAGPSSPDGNIAPSEPSIAARLRPLPRDVGEPIAQPPRSACVSRVLANQPVVEGVERAEQGPNRRASAASDASGAFAASGTARSRPDRRLKAVGPSASLAQYRAHQSERSAGPCGALASTRSCQPSAGKARGLGARPHPERAASSAIRSPIGS
jgi:hypothetical protein